MMFDEFDGMLTRLSGSRQNIRNVSAWMRDQSEECVSQVACWINHIRHPNTRALYRLSLLHLANDVIQSRHSSASKFAAEFKKCLVLAFRHLNDACIRRRVQRVLEIWETTSVYEKAFIQKLRVVIEDEWNILDFSARILEDVSQDLCDVEKIPIPDNPAEAFIRGHQSKLNQVRGLCLPNVDEHYQEAIQEEITSLKNAQDSIDRLSSERLIFLRFLEYAQNHFATEYANAATIYDTYERFRRRLDRSLDEISRVEDKLQKETSWSSKWRKKRRFDDRSRAKGSREMTTNEDSKARRR